MQLGGGGGGGEQVELYEMGTGMKKGTRTENQKWAC